MSNSATGNMSFVVLLLTLSALRTTGTEAVRRDKSEVPAPTSLVSLLANPREFDGRLVRVAGYYRRGFEDSSLFLTKDSADMGDISSSIWITLPDWSSSRSNVVRRGFVMITGVFHGDTRGGFGHLGAWSGAINNVSSFEAVPTRWDIPSLTDAVFVVISAFSLVYACFSRSWLRALLVPLCVSIVWSATRALAIFIAHHDLVLPLGSVFAGPLLWILYSALARLAKLFVFKFPTPARLERAVVELMK